MKKGDRIPGLIGWEYHGDPPKDLPGLEILAEGTAFQGGVRPQHWTATIYPGPKGNFVFNASTIFWSQGLTLPAGPHAALVALEQARTGPMNACSKSPGTCSARRWAVRSS